MSDFEHLKKSLGSPNSSPDICPCCGIQMSIKGWENIDNEKRWYCRNCNARFYWETT